MKIADIKAFFKGVPVWWTVGLWFLDVMAYSRKDRKP
jgi:hypothetical protein